MSRTVVLTFDYELFFLGGTVERCLIAPTDAILRELAAVGGHATFFVDATFLLRLLDEPRAKDDAARVCDQIGRLVSQGHRAELHVHPQWLEATWAGDGTWSFSTLRSSVLGVLDAPRVVEMMTASADALLSAARAAVPTYALDAFRAPGLCAEPFAAMAEGMRALDLAIDSSIAPGMVRRTELQTVDHRGAPDAAWWRFEDDPLTPVPGGRFIELPITCVRSWLGTKIRRRSDRAARPDGYAVFGDGGWMPATEGPGVRFAPAVSCITLEATFPALLSRALTRAGDVVTLLSHPKAMSPVSLESLRWLAGAGWDLALPRAVVGGTAGVLDSVR